MIKFKIKNATKCNVEQVNKEKSPPPLYYDLNNSEAIRRAMSDDYYAFVKQGKIRAKKAGIKRFESNGVFLDDESFIEADAVILCSGFNVSNDFFDKDSFIYEKYLLLNGY